MTCISNNISISGGRSRLEVGESTQLSYSFANSTYAKLATPQVTWSSSNTNVATVYNGTVTAKSSGTVTISASSNLGNNVANYVITVEAVDPTDVSILPADASVYCGNTLQLYVSVTPTTASKSVTWSVVEGSDSIATLSGSGLVTGYNPGTIQVKAMTSNGLSDKRTVTVLEPMLTLKSITPETDSIKQNVFVTPSAIFSHAIIQGENYAQITLTDADGNAVEGSTSITSKTLSFQPTHPLSPNKRYTLNIPAKAIANKWGTLYTEAIDIPFETGDLERLKLSISPAQKFVQAGATAQLSCTPIEAKIYYTADGTEPSLQSAVYESPIQIETDATIWAVAQLDGYENDTLKQVYYISNVAVTHCYPNDDEPLYRYVDVVPSISFSNRITASSNLKNINLVREGVGTMESTTIVSDSAIYILPKEQLAMGEVYKIMIPANAIATWQGEYNEAAEWTFATGDYVKDISAGGPELSLALKTDNTLLAWGEKLKSAKASDGSTNYSNVDSPTEFLTGVVGMATGYTHHAAILSDGSLWMWGRQYCGELGNNSQEAVTTPVKVASSGVRSVSAGGQTTAVIQDDNTLWMCGRNDFGQLGDSTTTMRKSLVQVLSNVESVAAGWGNTFAVTLDHKLYGWGRNDLHQLPGQSGDRVVLPALLMDDVAEVATSVSSSKYFAAIRTNGDLILWEAGKDTVETVDYGVASVSVGKDYVMYVKADNSLWGVGVNSYGQLGDGTSEARSVPTHIADGILSVRAAIETTYALKENGSVWAWGRNTNGLLGQADYHSELSLKPTQTVQGREMSDLAGLSGRKTKLTILPQTYGVVPVYTQPLTANYDTIYWESSASDIVSVDGQGVIYGEALGRADVTATVFDRSGASYASTCRILVSENLSDEIEDDPNADEPETPGGDDLNGLTQPTDNREPTVWTVGVEVHVAHAALGAPVQLIGVQGVVLTATLAHGSELVLIAPAAGVYVVTIGPRSYKAVCR